MRVKPSEDPQGTLPSLCSRDSDFVSGQALVGAGGASMYQVRRPAASSLTPGSLSTRLHLIPRQSLRALA